MSRQLKVLQITNRLPYPLNDGGNIATYNVTKYLHELGHQVTLASLNTKKHYQDPAVLNNIATVVAVDIDTSLSLFGLAKGLFSSFPYNVKRFESNSFREALKKILTNDTFDVIQLEGIYLAIYIDLLREYSQAKIVLRSHNIEHEIWQRAAVSESNFIKQVYFKNLSGKIKSFEKKALHQFDGIIAITSKDEQFYRNEKYKGVLTTINAGVDIGASIKAKAVQNKYTLCFLGSMEWFPNLQGIQWFLKEVWPLVINKYPKAEFHVAGKNMPGYLREQNIPGVTFHGMVPDALEFISFYNIVVVPLQAGGGMRLKVIEAMAASKAIISTKIGAEGILVKDHEHILFAETPDEFLNNIILLWGNEQLNEKISRSARKYAEENYNWENLVKKFESFYLSLV